MASYNSYDCLANQNYEDPAFAAPMPWIGLYIAAASLACFIAMAADALRGFSQQKIFFPCKFFTLNAASQHRYAVHHDEQFHAFYWLHERQRDLRECDRLEHFGNHHCCECRDPTSNWCNLCPRGRARHNYVFPDCSASATDFLSSFSGFIRKHWMMAQSSSPQLVMANSVTCSASGVICVLSTLTLAQAVMRSVFLPHTITKCSGVSNYNWSIFLVLAAQGMSVGVGTIAPAFRWFTLRIQGRKCRKLVEGTKTLVLTFCIGLHIATVIASKLVQFITILFISSIMLCWCYCKGLKGKLISGSAIPNNDMGSEMECDGKLDPRHYVFHLEGEEEELPQRILKKISNAADSLIWKGKKQQPTYLLKLLEKSTGFKRVAEFDSNHVPSLDSEDPPNCWTLTVVTLTSISISLLDIEDEKVEWILASVSEGLRYARLVEKNVNSKEKLVNIRGAADMIWLGVDLYKKWLDIDLRKIALEAKTSRETLERLSNIARNIFVETKRNTNVSLEANPFNWPIKAIAANSMYRVSQTVLLDWEESNKQTAKRLFEQLSNEIADILGACLTNLPHIITRRCICNAIEEREECVRHAACLLGETEEILKVLQQLEFPFLDLDQAVYIHNWQALIKKKNCPASSSSRNTDTVTHEFCLMIE